MFFLCRDVLSDYDSGCDAYSHLPWICGDLLQLQWKKQVYSAHRSYERHWNVDLYCVKHT